MLVQEGDKWFSVDEETGGKKEVKLARFSLLPVGPMTELAEHYGKGAQKYADRNWELGYDWALSFDAAMRHAFAFWGGEDYDPETGSKHVIAAAWHLIALAEFMDKKAEKDNRATTVANAKLKAPVKKAKVKK